MDLTTFVEPTRTRKVGEQEVTIASPAKIKIQTTGPGAATLLDAGPDPGTVWVVLIRVEAKVQ